MRVPSQRSNRSRVDTKFKLWKYFGSFYFCDSGHEGRVRLNLAQIPPGVKLVVVLEPALADVIAVVHVRNHDVPDARIGLCLSLAHRLPKSADHQHHARGPGHVPLSVHLHHVLDVYLFGDGFLEEDGRMLRYGEECGVIVERERRNDEPHADLEAALHLELRVHACGEILEPVRIRRASDYHVALRSQRLSLLALPERVVEHNDVGPLHLALPVVHFRHETVGDVALLLVLDAIAHFVAFLGHLPGDIADEPGNRNEKKLALVAVH
jgi:hypothetical protein